MKIFMIYTKVIRDYCSQNKGIIFDISNEYKTHFNMIPYKTFCKILNRLVEEGVLKKISHGSYEIVKDKKDTTDSVVSYYTHSEHGVVVGYSFYNEVGVSDFNDDNIVIYTNLITSKTKTIGNHKLIKVDINGFNKSIRSIIYMLELIENAGNIKNCEEVQRLAMIAVYIPDYLDVFFEEVIESKKYSYSTICTLSRYLNDAHKFNNCLEIYKRVDKESFN